MSGFQEVNFDGLIGPTHNYAGLALGNLAAAENAGDVSNPRAAALQGLIKMRAVMDLGLVQGFLPPQSRPHLHTLRGLGFSGTDKQIICAAVTHSPGLLANVYSASCMWTANAATVAPSLDTQDGRVHFTPANLARNFHRAIEPDQTALALKHIFADPSFFVHHPPLPGGIHFGDEGAANHGRLAASHAAPGVHLFVYGEDGDRFPARQKLAASQAVARSHGLAGDKTVYVQQSKAALDAGAFHNDVVGVANEQVLFLHEQSFENREAAYAAIRAAAPNVQIVEASSDDVSLQDAVGSYLFNSQLLTLPDGTQALILPTESAENPRVKAFLDKMIAGNGPIASVHFLNVRESMRNGGGPACLRLRVVLSDSELSAVDQNFILSAEKIDKLEAWVRDHYRDRLSPDDLRDPDFMDEAFGALDALTQLLGMGSFYDFQN